MRKWKSAACFSLIVLMLFAGLAFAAGEDIPRITIEELKKLIDDKADIVILDAQGKNVYDGGHIKGALSFPWVMEVKPSDVQKLPKDKLTITYCDCGPGEADSSDLASQLMGLGFTNVKVLADPSIRGWLKAGYPIER